MTDTEQRQYLDDVPRDIQDLIYEGRHTEATQLLMDQKGLQKMQAAMEAGSIAIRMSEEFPDAVSGPSSGPAGIGSPTTTSRRRTDSPPCRAYKT